MAECTFPLCRCNPDQFCAEQRAKRAEAKIAYAANFLYDLKRECVDDCEGFRDPCVACVVNETLRSLGVG